MVELVLQIKNLTISINNKKLICSSDFSVQKGEVVGLFGESGSGKSVFSLFLLGLLNVSTFSVFADSAWFLKNKRRAFNFLSKNKRDWNRFRSKHISLVFQDPATSLNPVLTCGQQLEEVFVLLGKKKQKKLCFTLFGEVGLVDVEKVYLSFPHELSGGQKQRVVIAISLASNPDVLVADEPTTSLDPSIQREVLDLIIRLKISR